MSAAYRAALRALAVIRERLADPALTDADRTAALAELDQAIAILGRDEHRASTRALAKRVQDLDRKMADLDPAARNEAVRQRLGLSRSRLYELRAVRLSPDGDMV